MKLIYYVLLLAFCSSFTLFWGRKTNIYSSPNLDKTMVYIPASTFNYREADPLKIGDEYVQVSVVNLSSFYMMPYEVSNGQYLEFINDVKKNKSDSIYQLTLPDTLVWREKLAYNEPYVEYYLRHPAYNQYPVVGVNHHQCEMYCEWLTKKYNQTEKRKFKKVKFRLPTKQEWYAATQVDLRVKKPDKNVKSDLNSRYKIFPWEGYWLRNKDGNYLANFKIIDESTIYRLSDTVYSQNSDKKEVRTQYISKRGQSEYMSIAATLNDNADVTAPVKSYWPNEAGIYCLAGNVEEFVAEYGFTKGGSWRDPGYYLRNEVVEVYDSINETSSERGFRFVMEVVEE